MSRDPSAEPMSDMDPETAPKTLRTRAFGALVRPLLHRYWRLTRGMTLGVRGAVLTGDRRVFLLRHTYTAGWYLPGGGVEAGETALDALVRELQEEACVEVAGPPMLHGVYFNRGISERDHVLVYVVRDFRITAEKQPDREIAEAGFFPLDALPPETSPGTRRRIDEIVRGGAAPSGLW